MKKGLIATVLIAAALTSTVSANAFGKKAKCYGVAKKGKNDCGANGHSCAGQAKVDGDANEWIFMPKGLCKKIVGGSLKPKSS